MVIAAVIGLRELALAVDGAAEFAGQNHQRVVQHAALFEILHQRPAGLVDLLALAGQHLRQIAVDVPAAMVDLHEAHAALGQAARHQARSARTTPGLRASSPYSFQVLSGSLLDVGQFGHRSSACGTPSRTARCACASPDRPASRIAAGSSRTANRACGGALPPGTPSGLLMKSTGSPALRRLTPEYWPERNPALHMRAEMACTLALG